MWYLPISFNHNQLHCDKSPRRQHVCVSAPTNVSDFNLTGQTITEIEVAVLNLPTIAPNLNLSLHSEWKDLLHSCAVRGILRLWTSTSCCNCNPGGGGYFARSVPRSLLWKKTGKPPVWQLRSVPVQNESSPSSAGSSPNCASLATLRDPSRPNQLPERGRRSRIRLSLVWWLFWWQFSTNLVKTTTRWMSMIMECENRWLNRSKRVEK